MTCVKKAKLAKKNGNIAGIARQRHKANHDKDKAKANQEQKHKHRIAFVWKDCGRSVVVMNEIASANTGLPGTAAIQATPACLIATGNRKSLKICTSGWRKSTGPGSTNLNGEQWTQLVRSFSKTVDFQLKLSIRDSPKSSERIPENDGRYDACHAEKKLALFFLAKQMRFAGVGLRNALQGKLREAKLPLRRRSARIYLGHKPCKSCSNFLRCIRRLTGIDVRAVSCPVLCEHVRTRTFFDGPSNNTRAFGGQADLNKNNFDKDDQSDDENEGEDNAETVNDGQKYKSGDDGDDEAEDDDDVEMSDKVDDLDAVEEILAEFPVGNVARPRCTTPVPKLQKVEEDHVNEEPQPEPDLPVGPPVPSGNISVRSSPSPSVSLASVLDSSVIDRRDRFPVYTSPSRRGGSVAPPSIWGARHKPPITPCLEAPDFCGGQGHMTGDNGGVSSSWVAANEQSYFFGTPSVPSAPSERGGPVETSAIMNGSLNTNTGTAARGTLTVPILVDDAQAPMLTDLRSTMSPSVRVERSRNERRNRVQQQQQQIPVRSSLDILSEAAHAVRANTRQTTVAATTPNMPSDNMPAYLRSLRSSQHSYAGAVNAGGGGNQTSNGIGRIDHGGSQFPNHAPVVHTPVVDLTNDVEDRTAIHRPFDRRTDSRGCPIPMPLYEMQQRQSQQQHQPDMVLLSSRPATTGGGFIGRGGRVGTPIPTFSPKGRSQQSRRQPQQQPPLPMAMPMLPPVPVYQPPHSRRRRGVATPVRRRGGGRGGRGRGAQSSGTARPFPDLSSFVYGDGAGWV